MKIFYRKGLNRPLTRKLNLKIRLTVCFITTIILTVQANVSNSSIRNNFNENGIKFNSKLQHEINGVIMDAFGVPLPGASILEKGTSNGVQADFDGKFQIILSSKDAVLVISYLGFVTQEIEVKGQPSITISMEEDIANLDEAIVIGYGERTKKSIAG